MMMFTAPVTAQKKPVPFVQNWEVAATIPAVEGQAKALGVAGPVAGFHNGVVIVAGGANFPGKMPWEGGAKKYYDEVFVYNIVHNQLLLLKTTFKLREPVAYAASVSTTFGIVYAGGENKNGMCNGVVLLQWDPVLQTVILKELPSLPFGVTNASISTYKDGLYLAGGETSNGVSNQFYFLQLGDTTSGWKELPCVPIPLSHAVMMAQSNDLQECIYLVGGRRKNSNGISTIYDQVFQFDIKKKVWSKKASLPYALSAGTGIAPGDGSLLLFGGDKAETFSKVETLIAAIDTEKEEERRKELIIKKNSLQLNHPGFSRQVLAYDIMKDKWLQQGKIPFDVPVTTTAFLLKDRVFIVSGEIKAGVRTPQIVSGKLKEQVPALIENKQ